MFCKPISTIPFLVLICIITTLPKYINGNENATTNNNETIAQLNEHQKYYKQIYYKWLQCMVVRQMAYSATKYETKAIAFLLSEGQSITLDSWLCLLPDQNDKVTVRWKFLAIDGTELSFIEQDGDKYFVHQDSKSLEITNVKKKDTGFYFANVNYEHDSAAYFVEVSNSDVFETHETDSTYEPPEHVIQFLNLRISVRMSEWSPCSRYNLIGIRQRFGTCFVEPHDYEKPIKPVHYPIMDMFIGGLPCRSTFLPNELKEMTEAKNTKSVYQTGFCKVPSVEESKDNKTKGIITLLTQTANIIMQRVFKSLTVIRAVNKGTILVCPDYETLFYDRKNRLGRPIFWRKDGQPIFSQNIREKTMGRILIDYTGRIRIRRLKMEDTGSYSCWIGDHLAGSVKLIVKNRLAPPTHLISMLPTLSYVVVLIVLFIFGFKLWSNHRNHNL